VGRKTLTQSISLLPGPVWPCWRSKCVSLLSKFVQMSGCVLQILTYWFEAWTIKGFLLDGWMLSALGISAKFFVSHMPDA